MILKGNQRSGAKQLALHLLNNRDNEHVELHELRGFMADDLQGALHEAYAVSRGTRAKQFLFSLSLNPPPHEKVSIAAFEKAIEQVEQSLGLKNQPRAIVFHEKEGRRHAHVVWSRIDAEHMRAINLPFYKLKLREVSKELFFEHDWQMPRGLVNSKERDPANYSFAEWQQAKRAGHDPKALKQMFQDCWAISDSRKAFAQALQSRGFTLARGDRRGHVAVDYRGEIYAISKYVGVKTKDVQNRLGDAKELPSVPEAKAQIAERMSAMLRGHIKEAELRLQKQSAAFALRKVEIIERQREERLHLKQRHEERHVKETQERSLRFRKGFRGLWDRVNGSHTRIRKQNELETLQSWQRDRAEKEELIFRQLDERALLHEQSKEMKQAQAQQIAQLHRDIGGYSEMAATPPPNLREHFEKASKSEKQREPKDSRQPSFDRDR